MSTTTITPVPNGITGTMCVLLNCFVNCSKRAGKSSDRFVQNLNNLIFDSPLCRPRFHGAVRELAGTGSVELPGEPNCVIKTGLVTWNLSAQLG